MDRLLDISRQDGYPLCAETLELLHTNVQLLETVLNGLNLPQHTIVRFPYGNFAYVQSNPSTSGRGEILEIATGANLANDDIHSYSITTADYDVEDSNQITYTGVYQERSLNMSSQSAQSMNVRVYNYNELYQFAMWKVLSVYRYLDENDDVMSPSPISTSITPKLIVKYNDNELRVRICMAVSNMPIYSQSEFRIAFNCSYNSLIINDVLLLQAFFKGNNDQIKQSVEATIERCTLGNTHVVQVKVKTGQLYSSGSVTNFTGQITINGVISLDN